MNELSRSEKINLLKIKNKRKAIIKDFEERNISLTLNSFCGINYSINLLEQLFIRIDRAIDYKDEFKFEHSPEIVKEQLSKNIIPLLSPTKLDSEVLLFHLNYRETGAINITLKDALKNVDWIVDFTGYPIGRMDFVLIEPNYSFGICVERWEYQDTFISWGLFK